MENINNCKVRLEGITSFKLEQLHHRLISLGITYMSSERVLEVIPAHFIPLNFYYGITIRNGRLFFSMRELIFNTINLPELTYQEIINYNQMKELPQKWCIRQVASDEVCEWFNNNGSRGSSAYTRGSYNYLKHDVNNPHDSKFAMHIPPGYTEITLEDFNKIVLKKGVEAVNAPIDELTLKCIKAPKKAKNITVEEEYTGILIDADNNQVDSWDDAEYFLCGNNSGTEARYKLELFESIVPAKPTFEEVVANTTVTSNSVVCNFAGSEIQLAPVGYSMLERFTHNSFNCGAEIIGDMNSLWDALEEDVETDEIDLTVPHIELTKALFKKAIKAFVGSRRAYRGFLLFSNNHDNADIIEVMDELADVMTEAVINPNSGNAIKIWIVYTTDVVDEPFDVEGDDD